MLKKTRRFDRNAGLLRANMGHVLHSPDTRDAGDRAADLLREPLRRERRGASLMLALMGKRGGFDEARGELRAGGKTRRKNENTFRHGAICGLALFSGSVLQLAGMQGTTAGKAASSPIPSSSSSRCTASSPALWAVESRGGYGHSLDGAVLELAHELVARPDEIGSGRCLFQWT